MRGGEEEDVCSYRDGEGCGEVKPEQDEVCGDEPGAAGRDAVACDAGDYAGEGEEGCAEEEGFGWVC